MSLVQIRNAVSYSVDPYYFLSGMITRVKTKFENPFKCKFCSYFVERSFVLR